MSYDDKAPKIPKLTGPLNYRIWAEEVRSFLEARGLLDLVLGDEPRPPSTTPATSTRRTTGTRAKGPSQAQSGDFEAEADAETLSAQEKWRRKNARARTCMMGYCSLTMKNKIIDLPTAYEQWEALRKDCRPSNDISLATYTSQFYGYEPKQGATVDSISNDLRDLQAFIYATDPNESPTEKSKISALLRAIRKLSVDYHTRIEILEDRMSTLDYDSVVVSLKETEQRLKARSTDGYADERALTANDRLRKHPKRPVKPSGSGQESLKRKRACWCCGDEGHIKTECRVWLLTLDGKAFVKRAKTASTGPLPTPGVS